MYFLRDYLSTPNCTTYGRTPVELMIARQVRTPALSSTAIRRSRQDAAAALQCVRDRGPRLRTELRCYRKVKWLPGRITSSLDTRMFTVQCTDGIHRRHIDNMRHRVKTSPVPVRPPVKELRLPTNVRSSCISTTFANT